MKKLHFLILPMIVAANLAFGAGPPINANNMANKQKSTTHAFKETVRIKNVIYSPASQVIMIQFIQDIPDAVTFGLYDAAGHLLATRSDRGRRAGTLFFNSSDLVSGTYILRLENKEQNTMKAVIVMR
jgi:hypothetical protein